MSKSISFMKLLNRTRQMCEENTSPEHFSHLSSQPDPCAPAPRALDGGWGRGRGQEHGFLQPLQPLSHRVILGIVFNSSWLPCKKQWFSTEGKFALPPKEHSTSRGIFLLSKLEGAVAIGISAKLRDAAEYTTLCRPVPTGE